MRALDVAQLDRLVAECGDHAFVGGLVRRYRSLLPGRVCAVVTHLGARDLDAALDRVLSLKVSSATVGADELAALATRVQTELVDGALDAAVTTAGRLPSAAERADGALAAYAGC